MEAAETLNQVCEEVGVCTPEAQEIVCIKELILDVLEHEAMGGGRVVNPARARATPCKCYKVEEDGFEFCFSPGIIGGISSKKNPEQIKEYCAMGKTYLMDGITKRIKKVRQAVSEAHQEWEKTGGGLTAWWDAIARSLEKYGVEL